MGKMLFGAALGGGGLPPFHWGTARILMTTRLDIPAFYAIE